MSIFSKKKSNNGNKDAAINLSGTSVKEAILECLRRLNCDCEKEETDGSNDVFYTFKFQSKNFRVQISAEREYVTIVYPAFYVTSIDNLNIVRELTNFYNCSSYVHKSLYTITEDKIAVLVHGEVTIDHCSVESLVHLLEGFFSLQHDFTYNIDNAINSNRGGFFRDIEYHKAISARELIVSRELEMRHQAMGHTYRSSIDFSFTLEDYMDLACESVKIAHYDRLRIVAGDEMSVYDEEEFIRSLPMHYPLIAITGKDKDAAAAIEARFEAERAVMMVDFTDSDGTEQSMTINVEAQGEDNVTLYYRAYSMSKPVNVGRENPLSHAKSLPAAHGVTSVMLAFDKADNKKKLQEFDFMWKEAQDKCSSNDANASDDDILLGAIADYHVGLSFYWGRRCFVKGCYAQALMHFITAYDMIKTNLDSSLNDAKENLCYHIGLCYCELGMYERAFFYLDLNRNSGDQKSLVELVNALANVGDVRAFHFIDEYMKMAVNYINNADGDTRWAEVFISFLKRRHAYCLINFGKLDAAEEEFKELLNDQRSRDYALDELAYIQHLRKSSESQVDEANGENERAAH